jgi:hypothetical protein
MGKLLFLTNASLQKYVRRCGIELFLKAFIAVAFLLFKIII